MKSAETGVDEFKELKELMRLGRGFGGPYRQGENSQAEAYYLWGQRPLLEHKI